MGRDAAERLVRAATAIGIAEEAAPGIWMLGRHGAALCGNEAALAMIRHHHLLYNDLADPLALLRADRIAPTALSRFWTYAGSDREAPAANGSTAPYSELMRASQAAVAEEVVAGFDFSGSASLLDIGGGTGAFLRAVGEANPELRLGLFDLPEVVEQARNAFLDQGVGERAKFYPGNFFKEPLPGDYDLVSLIRIIHDHDDDSAQLLLRHIHKAMNPGARLLIAEPMAATRGAEAMGDAYFGLYLWAMGSGRPRRAGEIQAMLRDAGFAQSRTLPTDQPLLVSLVVAIA